MNDRPPMHDDEFSIDVSLVRELLKRSLPHLAGRPLRALSSQGSSNALFRLGDDLLVRLPRQPGGSATIVKEARWVPHIAAALPVAVPEIIAMGEPGPGYPERWSMVRWIDGRRPQPAPVGGRAVRGLAQDLAAVLVALRHVPVPPAARHDPDLRSYRGEPLRSADAVIRGYLFDCRDLPLDLDLEACERVWDEAIAREAADDMVESRWLHGDLAAENLLVDGARLAAVLDFGGLAVGNPTVDLAVAWEVFNPAERAVFRAELQVDDVTWLLGRAWLWRWQS